MRRKDIDWLRIFGIFLLFPFHTAKIFDPRESFYIHSEAVLPAGVAFMDLIWPWFMPLLFLVAGMAAWYSLQQRNARQYLQERVLRLFLPLVLGTILIVPIQGYMARLQRGTLNGGYSNYLVTQFFTDFSDISGYQGTFTPAHLWFILFLFVFSCVLLPLFIHILQSGQKNGTGSFGHLFEKGWFLISLFVPLTISQAIPEIGGKNPVFYGLYFTIGFFIASNEKSIKTIGKIRWLSFSLMALSLPVYLFLLDFSNGFHNFAWPAILCALVRNLYGVNTLLTMLAFAYKYLNRGGKILDYLNQAAFPVYILHQSVMMVIAYYILLWFNDVHLQFILIAVFTLIISFVLFEVSRHFTLFRIILGIKTGEKKPAL